jgi:hypothetical protein
VAFTPTKKVYIGSSNKVRIRILSQTSRSVSDQKGPDPTISATLLLTTFVLRPDDVPAYEGHHDEDLRSNHLRTLRQGLLQGRLFEDFRCFIPVLWIRIFLLRIRIRLFKELPVRIRIRLFKKFRIRFLVRPSISTFSPEP